jgi:hypothetical protein
MCGSFSGAFAGHDNVTARNLSRREDAEMRIACLHTVESNIDAFAVANGEVELRHEVRADLLARAEAAGRLTEEIADETRKALLALGEDADAVLLTCSTLGPAAAMAAPATTVPVLRVDEALARQATASGGRVVVLCAVETTIAPTRALFEKAAAGTGATIDVQLVPGAWTEFKAGRTDRYHAAIAAAADAAFHDGASAVALAQASMAGAAALCRKGKPLASPAIGLAAAIEAARLRARGGVA